VTTMSDAHPTGNAEGTGMLTIDGLYKAYGPTDAAKGKRRLGRRPKAVETDRVYAADGVTFTVEQGELFTLLGPSGCGKTTTLRSVAGLERPDRGRITVGKRTLFDGEANTNVPANQRGLGMVFQSYAIWPHMTVFKNASFPLEVMPRSRRLSRRDVQERVMRALEATELSVFADRPATKLSGGQQQRLALARALVTEPELMLLDEPLSNLDAKLRETMRFELKRLQRELNLTAVYVTHDQAEALALSSRIAVMNAGKIEQIGKPREIYTAPKTQFVAEFIGTSNFLSGRVGRRADGFVCIDTVDGPLWSLADDVPEGTEVLVSLRPENLSLSTQQSPSGARNELRATVVNRAFMGDSVDHVVSLGKLELRVKCNPSVSIPPGNEVYVSADPANVTLVPAE